MISGEWHARFVRSHDCLLLFISLYHFNAMKNKKNGLNRLNRYGDRHLEDHGWYNHDLGLLFLIIIEILWEDVIWLQFKEFCCKKWLSHSFSSLTPINTVTNKGGGSGLFSKMLADFGSPTPV